LAGKLDRHPSEQLFAIVDRRGARSEDEERDEYVVDRQLAAQLLKIFLAHERDPAAFAAISANELDNLYHAETDWEATGPTASKFKEVLNLTGQVFEIIRTINPGTKKFRRLDVTVIMLYLQDLMRSPNVKMDRKFLDSVAESFTSESGEDRPAGIKNSSAVLLKKYYEWWRVHSPDRKLIRLDPRRMFDESQKKAIWKEASGQCAICKKPTTDEDCEYDHFPIPFRDGGPTEISNGRLVHATCHPRGRPTADESAKK
jgi:hypothetical protein